MEHFSNHSAFCWVVLFVGGDYAVLPQIAVDRYYHQTDLSDCLFTLRAVNSGGGLVMQNLEKEVTESQIILTWTIAEDFTAVPGELLPEIVGQKDDTVVIKYEMTPMIVRNSILEQYKGPIIVEEKTIPFETTPTFA